MNDRYHAHPPRPGPTFAHRLRSSPDLRSIGGPCTPIPTHSRHQPHTHHHHHRSSPRPLSNRGTTPIQLDLDRRPDEVRSATSAVPLRTAARAEVRRLAASNTPPDLRLAAQLELNTQHPRRQPAASANCSPKSRRSKLAELRRSPRPPNAPASPAKPSTDDTPPSDTETRPPFPAHPLPPANLPASSISESAYRGAREQRRRQTCGRLLHPPHALDGAPHRARRSSPASSELGLLPAGDVSHPQPVLRRQGRTRPQAVLRPAPQRVGPGQLRQLPRPGPRLRRRPHGVVRTRTQGAHPQRAHRRQLRVQLTSLFWDGRASSLEQQASDVVKNHRRNALQRLVGPDAPRRHPRLRRTEFQAVFGSPDVTLDRAAQAIATFERTLTSRGKQLRRLPPGRHQFPRAPKPSVGSTSSAPPPAASIATSAPTFTDGLFHNEGLTYYGRKYEDLGRYLGHQGTRPTSAASKRPRCATSPAPRPTCTTASSNSKGSSTCTTPACPHPVAVRTRQDDKLFPVKSPHARTPRTQHDRTSPTSRPSSNPSPRPAWRLRPPATALRTTRPTTLNPPPQRTPHRCTDRLASPLPRPAHQPNPWALRYPSGVIRRSCRK
jgi:hypothetical protein